MKFYQLVLKISSGNKILAQITNVRKMTCYNPKLDLVNMNAYVKFAEKMSVSYQDIERELTFRVNQGP